MPGVPQRADAAWVWAKERNEGFKSWSDRWSDRIGIDAPSIRKAVLCFFFLFICTPLGQLIAWVQFSGYAPTMDEYTAQQEEYHDQFMAFLSDYLPDDPAGDDLYHETLRSMTQGMRSAADMGASGMAWMVDYTVSMSTTATKYVLDAWKAFKIYLFSWIYGSILYLVAFSFLTDLITQKVQHRFWKGLNSVTGWKLKEQGFLFGAILTLILWLTPVGDVMEAGFNAIHWITYDALYS